MDYNQIEEKAKQLLDNMSKEELKEEAKEAKKNFKTKFSKYIIFDILILIIGITGIVLGYFLFSIFILIYILTKSLFPSFRIG